MPVPKQKNLDLIFCIKKQRTVNKDNTLSFNGQVIQIPPSEIRLSFVKTRVDVCLLEDRRIFVLYEGKVIAISAVSKDNEIIVREKKIEELLDKRQYTPLPVQKKQRLFYIPPANHPWRKALAKNVRLKQIKQTKAEIKAQREIEKIFGGLIRFVN